MPTKNLRLVEIEQDIHASGGLITPEQEAEIDALVLEAAQSAGEMAVEFKMRHDRLKKLVDQARVALAFMKNREESYRAKLVNALSRNAENGGARKVAPDDKSWSANLVNPTKGRVEITGEVPDTFMREEIVLKPDTEMIRAYLESGNEVPWAKIVREPHVRIVINEDLYLEREIKAAIGN